MTKQPVYHQGEIVYIPPKEGVSKNLVNRDRPAIVISRNSIAEKANFISVVYLTSQEKNDMGSHVELFVNGQRSIALCEQITSIPKDEVGKSLGKLRKGDMFKVALGILWANVPETIYDAAKAFKLLMKNI
ncbi:MAG: type II toxin-antitoxin system PemK/MazF family toxin [Acutalibacteraceae bacterium]|nr:type II toxin-antitoxin system PemK/MazF family toxin [Acutalibacteraceae bacterium]MEE0265164.1 type II toxin-antitoxin system PemK/MazF family toxin [Acutalibacteraceae bacterium]MEE1153920.1 type II toxin-antitoxin system PemK/MazF family toxin [Acutalibacteraceae bacterium]MEE1282918.1 type II toxin-antitoxin system PemK/MazF family toxin [Acutalibacteraceae bacterium]